MCRHLIHLVIIGVVTLSVPVKADMVGWWKFDDGGGTVALDSSGNDNHGTIFGGASFGAGQFGGSLSLDGTDDYVDLPIGVLMSELTNSTFTIWANWSGGGGGGQRIWDLGSGVSFYMYVTPNNEDTQDLRFTITIASWTDEDQSTAAEALPTGWHHIAVSLDSNAGTHTLYLDGEIVAQNTNARYTPSDLGETTQSWIGRSQFNPDPYYNGSVDDFQIHDEALSQAQIRTIMTAGTLPRGGARQPNPINGQTDVTRDNPVLSWRPGFDGATHDVYFGSAFDDVNDASRANPLGVLVSENQSPNTYTLGRLDIGQTYYWRVDEVNSIDNSIFKDRIWQFTVEPTSYPLPSDRITATASSVSGGDPETTLAGPEKTIDGSGLDENNGHSIISEDMWLSDSPDLSPWIQYTFDQVYQLDKMEVWNANQSEEFIIGWGVKDVQIETSLDGTTWSVVEGITQLAQAPGVEGADPTDIIDLAKTPAKFVRILISSNWGGILPQYGLSEVRFYFIPLRAREPVPASGTTGVFPDILSWRAGREAGTHEVYVSMDANAVLDDSAPMASVVDNRFDFSALDLPIGETYFWKVNEVNDAEEPSVWEGPIWSFSIPDPQVIDDFESYETGDVIPGRPFETWIDGVGYNNPAPGNPGNNTGATVGHDIWSIGSPHFDGDIMELVLVHGGAQSLPLYYNNSGAGGKETYSEMTRPFASARDWSGHQISTLTLYFRGMVGNAGQLYVKINDTKVLFTGDAGAISRPIWEQWNIDLAATGANLSNVQTLSVGIEGPGSGLLLVDDILLYRDAPPVVQGIDPGNAGLIASYQMENNVNDGSGQGRHATAVGDPVYEPGPTGFGMALVFDGTEDHVVLPIGSVLASLTDITVACWIDFADNGGSWQHLFNFGTGTTSYMFLTPSSGPASTATPIVGNVESGPMRFTITTGTTVAESLAEESTVNGLVTLPTGWHHVAVTIDSSTMMITLLMDGEVVGSGPTQWLPRDLGTTTQNWLGRSPFNLNAFFAGVLDEVFIYDRALSVAEIRYLAGEQ